MDVLIDRIAYGCNRLTWLSGFEFDAQSGVTWLRGENGSGKSTILRLIGQWQIDQIVFTGKIQGAMGSIYVPESGIGFFTFQTPRQSLFSEAIRRRIRFDECQQLALKLLSEVVGLAELFDSDTITFSQGERKLHAIAQAVSLGPRVLLLDEPYEFLDTEAIRTVEKWLRDFARHPGRKVVIASHIAPRGFDQLAEVQMPRNASLQPPNWDGLRKLLDSDSKAPEQGSELVLDGGAIIRSHRNLLGEVMWRRSVPLVRCRSGSITVISGRNGSGKTGVLRTLGGLRSPIEGQLWNNKTPVYKDRRSTNAMIASCHHTFTTGVALDQTFRRDIEIVCDNEGTKKIFEDAIGRHVVKELNGALSAGQRALLAFIAAMISTKRILIFDEPFAAFSEDWLQGGMELLGTCAGNSDSTLVLADHRSSNSSLLGGSNAAVCNVSL